MAGTERASSPAVQIYPSFLSCTVLRVRRGKGWGITHKYTYIQSTKAAWREGLQMLAAAAQQERPSQPGSWNRGGWARLEPRRGRQVTRGRERQAVVFRGRLPCVPARGVAQLAPSSCCLAGTHARREGGAPLWEGLRLPPGLRQRLNTKGSLEERGEDGGSLHGTVLPRMGWDKALPCATNSQA